MNVIGLGCPKHSSVMTYLEVPLQMAMPMVLSKMFKLLALFLQMKFHVETDQNRAILAKERREGWDLRLLPLAPETPPWNTVWEKRVREDLSSRMIFELRPEKS